jgi:hypothetical protein
LNDGVLILSTGAVRYEARWNEGHLIGMVLEIRDRPRINCGIDVRPVKA